MVELEAVRAQRREASLRLSKKALIRTVLACTTFIAAFAWGQWWDLATPSFFASPYQAVFLTNGQTYFGRYHDRFGPYAKIEGAYYIQQVQGATPEGTLERRIVRRGSELHEPRDRVLIPKEAILFVEDLRDGSAVRRFIEEREARR